MNIINHAPRKARNQTLNPSTKQTSSLIVNQQLLKGFQEFYESFNAGQLKLLDTIYSDSVVFVDPLHKIEGIDKLTDYFGQMCGNLTDCRFEFINSAVMDGQASYRWLMHYQHPKIGNKALTLKGASFIEFSDKIDFHEDFYDVGAMLYEHLPVIGRVIAMIKRKVVGK